MRIWDQNGLIKVITGARRAGKSYLLNELYYKHLLNDGVPSTNIIRFAFDSDEDLDLLDSYYSDERTKIERTPDVFVVNAKKYIGSPFKLYFEDFGVRNARLNFRQIEETHISRLLFIISFICLHNVHGSGRCIYGRLQGDILSPMKIF